ncbi:hypothetical protein ACWCQQ_40315 [Streptomyces sp. NPDC002143]
MLLRTTSVVSHRQRSHGVGGLHHGDVGHGPDPMGQDQEAFNACAVLISAGTALHLG